MSVDTRYFVDVFGDVVSEVRASYTSIDVPPDADQPFYLYGHIRDILNQLSLKDQDGTLKYKKYPLIALIQDFEEKKSGVGKYEYILPEIRALIITKTEPEYDSTRRYIRTFKPVLYPLWDLLLTKLADSPYIDISSKDHIEYSKHDRVYWGKTDEYGVTGHIFNDYLDAIDIKLKNLQVFKRSKC